MRFSGQRLFIERLAYNLFKNVFKGSAFCDNCIFLSMLQVLMRTYYYNYFIQILDCYYSFFAKKVSNRMYIKILEVLICFKSVDFVSLNPTVSNSCRLAKKCQWIDVIKQRKKEENSFLVILNSLIDSTKINRPGHNIPMYVLKEFSTDVCS